jgi:hypothetical protein
MYGMDDESFEYIARILRTEIFYLQNEKDIYRKNMKKEDIPEYKVYFRQLYEKACKECRNCRQQWKIFVYHHQILHNREQNRLSEE